MRIKEIKPQSNWMLYVVSEDGSAGNFDVAPYLEYKAFEDLREISEFMKVFNGSYFVE